MKVFVSHTGVKKWSNSFETHKSIIKDILFEMGNSGKFEQIFNKVIIMGKLSSAARIFANVEVEDLNGYFRFYENGDTVEIKGINDNVSGCNNLLIAYFDSYALLDLLNNTMRETSEAFIFKDEDDNQKSMDYRSMIRNIDFNVEVKEQILYDFISGQCSLNDLKYGDSEKSNILYKDGKIDKKNSKVLPSDLIEAIKELWKISTNDASLRLFQEDSLFFIKERLDHNSNCKEKDLLLSMPTGGGKTEAFMIPIIASIYEKKKIETRPRIKSIIIYPTNALANDQAARFVDIIYKVNKKLTEKGVPFDRKLSIGILSGDTPYSSYADIAKESLIRICPKCGKTNWHREGNSISCDNPDCGVNLSFCRLTKEDIFNNPPDILITNPDEINVCLHKPNYAQLFYNKVDSFVFDEVHLYQGVFGCHIAHLLRRLEEISESKPLYIGLSATIKNAKELAALLFNDKLEEIKYINDNNRDYTDVTKPAKKRVHALLRPAIISSRGDNIRYVRSLSVAGITGMFISHLISDSHFRKSIIFTNYRVETDDLASYLRERERTDFELLIQKTLDKCRRHLGLTSEEAEVCQYMIRWIQGILDACGNISPSMTIGWNRGGLEKETRIRSINSFSRNSLFDVDNEKYPVDLMMATKSLEVGIDIGDVTTVINSSAPFTANEYVQRVGRGGRKNDSLAITIINPENAIDGYFEKHFDDYVVARNDIFEEAPIIVNNDIIIHRHIVARLLDIIIKLSCTTMPGKKEIRCSDLISNLAIEKNGKMLRLGDGKSPEDVRKLCVALFDASFGKRNGVGTYFDTFTDFLKNETNILHTKLSTISKEDVIDKYFAILNNFNDRIQKNAKHKIDPSELIFGNKGMWTGFTPNLRGSGATVGLHIGTEEKVTDVVSRQTAFNQMPPGLDSKQVVSIHSGISTFKVDGFYKETDITTEKKIKRIINGDENVYNYFFGKIDNFPEQDDFTIEFTVKVPNDLSVSYYPSRFYCPKCKKGYMPNELDFSGENGVYCPSHHLVEQLGKVFICNECGGLFDPPVAKVCINPDCEEFNKMFIKYVNNGRKYNKSMFANFKFRLTRDLEWECCNCGCKINHYKNYLMERNNRFKHNFVQNVVNNWTIDRTTKNGLAVELKQKPEIFYNPSVFSCKNDHSHRVIDVIETPRVKTLAITYIGSNNVDLCESINNDICSVKFDKGYVLQLATQFSRRFVSGTFKNRTNRIKTDNIFTDTENFCALGNYYESHLAWIKFGDDLDGFLTNKKYSCNGDCAHCSKIDLFKKLDLGEDMIPKPELEDYNFDPTENKPRKPDFRAKYCGYARNGSCERKDCVNCSKFDKDSYLRYVLVHTLKHSILWAMPKYAGINVTDMKGEIYPNDGNNNVDFVLIDNNEGGSGSIVLVQRHWNEIMNFAEEIIGLTCNNKANILLAHNCFRGNKDLCPFITKEYFDLISSKK